MFNKILINKISSIKRFGSRFLFIEENIATHSLEMSMLCINFSKLVPESDKYIMCYKCTIHDCEEIIAGDVNRPLKWSSPELKEMIDKVSISLITPYVGEDLLQDIIYAKSFKDVNGFLVHIADRVQCWMKMKREADLGNKDIRKDLFEFYEDLKLVFQEIESTDLMSEESKLSLLNYLKDIINITEIH